MCLVQIIPMAYSQRDSNTFWQSISVLMIFGMHDRLDGTYNEADS